MGAKAAAALVKPHVSAILTVVMEQVAIAAGAKPGDTVSVRWVNAERANGSTTIMATVRHVNEMGDDGEEIGTIDVFKAAENVSLDMFIDG